ncbi:MAG: D-sedoheptulose 7-phosphate isomerase [Bacteroidales bacterium]|nr:D-sedoheptulose 7-phosphate isomerase [Bacteroidales bacterium]MBQ1831104.1 D-sedoheptulose 7-phosphate isomerase [Bacteroidales bacterium]MBQ2194441.1 D-sedoheptulose 7-phosphate isomerase [Bacteroidales bacterium]MBQ4222178.1 D-sedoheptulose 7-phosphate isomerase [Bacteroidales bacterium]MBQ5438539.1 D-sedoheptulose 7-phosphate isomerase [Bacteroidales bacterium]
MDSTAMIDARLGAHLDTMARIRQDADLIAAIARGIDLMTACFRNGGRVYFCGNGGSAADAQHLAAEFSGRFYFDRPVLPADALHCNTSYLTAVGNDYGYEQVFARLISGLGRKGDILVGLSTSGNSANILRAFEVCREKGVTTIAMTGASGGRMKELADLLINIPATDTPRIQEAHITVGHILCERVEDNIFGSGK